MGPKADLTEKERAELAFWHEYLQPIIGDSLQLQKHRQHYEFFATKFFGLSRDHYKETRILDVGCGPLGSLEWADMASERVGLDPLAPIYLGLSSCPHKMKYCQGSAENIPFEDSHFDKVFLFNSLDHVDHVDRAVNEVKRVLKPKGEILLIVEINHQPSSTEPHSFDERVCNLFSPFVAVDKRLFGIIDQYSLYKSIEENTPYSPSNPGMLTARMIGS